MSDSTARRRILKVPRDGVPEYRADLLAVEEPLEIRVEDSEMLPDNLDSLDKLTRFIERKRVLLTGAAG